MTAAPSVVITGAAGLVGGVLLAGLDPRFDVRGVDLRRPRREVSGRPVRRGNLVRPSTARRALVGADIVVDLASLASLTTSWRDVHRVNLRMVWNVLHAARDVGARRVVLASTNNVVAGYERDDPYRSVIAGDYGGLDPRELPRLTADVAVRPNGPYAVGKVLSEAAGRYVADEFGISVIALRIGTVRPSDHPETPRHFATLLTHRDLVHLVERCILASDNLRFATFYGVSDNTWRIWDIGAAQAAIGYSPRDDAESWRDGPRSTGS